VIKWIKRVTAKVRGKEAIEGPRREFVYLDEVSVYSLLASRRGAIPTELTDTDSETVRSSVGASLGANTPVGGAGLRSQLEGSRTRGTQVVRKANVQASFKDLVEHETGKMRIHDSVGTAHAPAVASLDDLKQIRDGDDTPHLVPVAGLARGDLLELEVTLDAESIFQASLMIATMLGFFDEAPEFFSMEPREMAQARGVNRVFDELLSGLVPIRGESTRYERIVIDREEFLASKELLNQLTDGVDVDRQPLHIVAVAEAELFWRDLRRVLFSDSSFFVMFRLNADGLRGSWNPVKVVDLLKRYVPSVGAAINHVGSEFLAGVTMGATSVASAQPGKERALVNQYADAVASEAGTNWSEEDTDAVDLDSLEVDLSSIEQQRKVLAPIVKRLEDRTGQQFDRARLSDLREQLMSQHGYRADSAEHGSRAVPEEGAGAKQEHLLDSEIVAIYW
jgi:hypothetical protein